MHSRDVHCFQIITFSRLELRVVVRLYSPLHCRKVMVYYINPSCSGFGKLFFSFLFSISHCSVCVILFIALGYPFCILKHVLLILCCNPLITSLTSTQMCMCFNLHDVHSKNHTFNP